MKFFTRLLGGGGEKKTTTGGVGTLALFRDIYGYPATKSGQQVNWRTALQVSTVLACVKSLTNGCAQVPLKIYRERADGGADPAKDHPAYRLLYAAPNDYQTAFEYFQQLVMHLALTGSHFSLKSMVRGQVLYELLPLEPG